MTATFVGSVLVSFSSISSAARSRTFRQRRLFAFAPFVATADGWSYLSPSGNTIQRERLGCEPNIHHAVRETLGRSAWRGPFLVRGRFHWGPPGARVGDDSPDRRAGRVLPRYAQIAGMRLTPPFDCPVLP